MNLPMVLASVIFLGSLALIFLEKFNRTIVSIAGACLMVITGILFGFYNEQDALSKVDFNTLGLLLGMMLLVALLEPTGFFQFMAAWAGKISKGRPVRLMLLMGAVTTLISMLLNNVTTVILIAPVTILICQILGFSPIPYLLSEALLSNIGGVATLIGDPPNVIIASAANLSFIDFLTHALPIIIIVWFVAVLLVGILFRKELSIKSKKVSAIRRLDPKEAFKDPRNATRVLFLLGVAILFFVLAHFIHISLALIALSAAGVALLWIQPDLDKTLGRIEWTVLIFFAALFVMVGGLEASGALDLIVGLFRGGSTLSQQGYGLIIIWLVAGLSAVVDNIPITIAMVPVIHGLAAAGIASGPLWWALALGAGLGGNGTIVGASANILVASLSERTNTPITPRLWNKRGLPVMLVTCLAASILYLIFYPIFLN